ncbi:MAG: type I methionyl aminopeptidase [Clostridiales bacterium]|jgi:methionyl aminopeptidase|nr:type I methionyl aminopeptidase [Clostridiales bacterium]
MAILIKGGQQIEKMKIASSIVAEAFELLEKEIRPGVTTKELDTIAEEFILSKGAVPSFKGYNGYPASICTAINEEVIHGIPGLKKLKDGDIIGIDIGAYINGYHGDAARTFPVGENVPDNAMKLIEVTKQSFFEGVKHAKDGSHLFEISEAIEDYVTSFGFSCVRDFVGHGIGKSMHEDPQIPHYKQKKRGPKLCKGMALAIEPMVNEGVYNVIILADGWTVITKDKKLSAHYENTVVITDGEPLILTLR